jgi:O-antigen/teichoic acid export membrane protein
MVGRDKSQVSVLGKAVSISVLNQAASSGTSFLFSLYLVRTLSPEAFGLYGVAFALVLFYAGIGNALFLTQMVVNTPDKEQHQRNAYTASMGMALVLFCACTAVAAILIPPTVGAVFPWIGGQSHFGYALAAASIGYLLRDFFARHAYSIRREIYALTVNLLVGGCLAVFVWWQHHEDIAISAEHALWLYAGSQFAGVIVAQFLARLPLLTVQFRQVLKDFEEAWKGGRWYLGVAFTYALQNQAHIIVVAFLIGSAGVGQLNAARLLVTPPLLLIPALTQVLLPKLSELRKEGGARAMQVALAFAFGFACLVSTYSLILFYFLDPIALVLLGPQYSTAALLTLSWCAYVGVLGIRTAASTAVQASRHFQVFFFSTAAGGLVAVGSAALLTSSLEAPGAIVGMTIGECVAALVLWRWMIRRHSNAPSLTTT